MWEDFRLGPQSGIVLFGNDIDILNMIENFSSEIKDQIKTLTLEARAKRIIKTLHDYLKKQQCHFVAIFPNIDQPWKTPFAFWITNWTVAHYLYMWYLMNTTCVFMLNQSFTTIFSLREMNIFINYGLKF